MDSTDLELAPSGESAWELLKVVREACPLVQCITNFVSMDISANGLLAVGASPAMAHAVEEVEEFIKIASVLVVNMGTLSEDWVTSMRLAATAATAQKKPWVLDPVGAGATTFRTQTIVNLLELRPSVVRGNASEILSLAGAAGATKGVDSTADSSQALQAAMQLAREYGCIVAVSGAVDLVTDGDQLVKVSNGTPLMTKITAAGCTVTAIIAAFISQAPQSMLLATAHALAVVGLAAEVAAVDEQGRPLASCRGPASLRVGMLDNLYTMDRATLTRRARISQQPL